MKISQREARRLRKQVAAFEELEMRRLRSWASEWPTGVEITNAVYDQTGAIPTAIRTARKLGHAVVVVENAGALRFVACSLVKS